MAETSHREAIHDDAEVPSESQSAAVGANAEELLQEESDSESDEYPTVTPDDDAGDETEQDALDVVLERINDDGMSTSTVDQSSPADHTPPPHESGPSESSASAPSLYDDPSDSDDGEGEWITPSNVALHKSHALDLLPSASGAQNGKGKGKAQDAIGTGCMTADFAMQNVLLQMGLNLVSVDGKRIDKVKSWVLRCHACFKYVSLRHVCSLTNS